MIDIKAIREQAENGYPVEDCVIPLCDEVDRLQDLLGKANALCRIRLERIKELEASE